LHVTAKAKDIIMLRPLNIADHFTLMMDHEIRKSGLAGNFCAIVFEMESALDAHALATKAAHFIERFPEANVRLVQQGRHYFWKACEQNESIFFAHSMDDEDAGLNHIQTIINTKSSIHDIAPIEFHLINMPHSAYFLLRWFHPICDAKGAELILHQLLSDKDISTDSSDDPFKELIKTWGLWKKIKMIYRSKQHVEKLGQTASSMPLLKPVLADELHTQLLRFDEDASKNILKQAMKEAGMTGTSLYFIGCLMRALVKTGCDEKEAFCVPYAMNMRKRKALFPLFGNQVSFLFAQASLEDVKSRSQLFATLRAQHKETIRAGLNQALIPLMQAGSWLSLEKYGDIIRKTPANEERSSFWFSYTGEPEPKITHIEGVPVQGMFQMSQVTSAPGLAMLVSQYHGKLTLSFNYVANQIDTAWLKTLLTHMQAELHPSE